MVQVNIRAIRDIIEEEYTRRDEDEGDTRQSNGKHAANRTVNREDTTPTHREQSDVDTTGMSSRHPHAASAPSTLSCHTIEEAFHEIAGHRTGSRRARRRTNSEREKKSDSY